MTGNVTAARNGRMVVRLATVSAVVLAVCLLAAAYPVLAEGPAEETGKQDTPVSPLLREFIEQREGSGAQSDTQPVIDAFARSQSGDGPTTKSASASAKSPPDTPDSRDDPVRFDSSGNVQVYIHLENTDSDTLRRIRDLGATIEITNSDWNVVQAWVPTTALEDIAALEAVQEITAPDYGFTKTGRVNSEGDGIHRADLVRSLSGINGRGVKVGVISDGVRAWRTSRSRNDLPDIIEINPNNGGSGGDEGTALLEIIHDLAPGAELAFSGSGSSLGFVEATLWLANDAFDGEGADIIVDDLAHYLEPYYEDGMVAEAVADAVAGGAVFVSAGGNNANKHYTGTFSDDGNGYHDFDSSSATDIALRVEPSSWIMLQWNDQFGFSSNDYDLFVCSPGRKPVKFNLQNGVCKGSTREQDGDDDPWERITSLYSFSSEADVYIRKFSGSAKELKLFVLRGEVLEHGVEEGGIIGHPALEEVLAVGAIDAADPGNDEPEFFSDRGSTEIYFPTRKTRNKPDVMGIDGVLITGAGRFGREIPGSSFRRFYGTSAAAPHVAGIAALVMEAQRRADPSMKKKAVADAVAQKLKDTAIDLGETGRDGTFGHGRADAWAAIESLAGASGADELELYFLTSYAATHTVNSTGDGADSDTTDGVCDDGTVDGSTNCTLRAAIEEANAGTGAVIEFNIPGGGVRTISPASALPLVTVPVFIDGFSQPGASAGTVLIELDGSNAGSGVDGLELKADRNLVRGLAVNSFSQDGIQIDKRTSTVQLASFRHVLVGNMIGTDPTGSTDEGNGWSGVHLNIAADVLLRDNVISGNGRYGVQTTIGGRIHLYGNKIGTNAAGTADLGNTLAGVSISSDPVVVRDNVISGNDTHGVFLQSNVTENAVIENNRIGTNDAGTAALGNTMSGIFFDGDPKNNLVTGNIISGNGSHGVRLSGTYVRDNLIAGNWIGTNASGTDLGNGGSGVYFSHGRLGGPDDNTVEGNTIAHNASDGVTVTGNDSLGNTIWENSIHSNDGHGIDLGDDGVTANDTRDLDSGPNHLQNHPYDITFASRGDDVSVRFTLDVTTNVTYVVDFYACDSSASGEGKDWLGFTLSSVDLGPLDVTATATFTASTLLGQLNEYTAPTGTHITATATDRQTGSTSEFAPCVARVALPELVISKTEVDVTEGSTATYTVSLSSAPSADMTVALSSGNTGVVTVSPTETTFTSTDFSENITVTGVADGDPDHEATEIRHLVTIGSNEYVTAVIPVDVTDDDQPGVTMASTTTGVTFPTDVSVGRFFDGRFGTGAHTFSEGETATYTVQLTAEPDGDITIALDSSDTGALTVSPSSITFTETGEASDPNKHEWDDPQTVTLAAVTDSDADDETADVSHETRIGGTDHVVGRVRAVIRDSALPGLTYQQNSADTEEISVNEGGTATYTVQMDGEPASNVTILIASSDTDSITVSHSSITFTKTGEAQDAGKYEWNDPQTVTVTGLADGDQFDDVAAILHWNNTARGRVFHRWPSLQVTVTDGNRAPFFEDGLATTREVPEDAGQDDEVGEPITATDLNTGDTLVYTLDDTSGKFSINGSTGQITVLADDSLDHETEEDYEMEVVVTDRTSDGLTDRIDVKVLVTNVNEAPTVAGEATLSFPEDTATTRVLDRYTATDPEQGTITWSVEGIDAGVFTIDGSGNLRFNGQQDYETKVSLDITIAVTDDGDPALKGELPVTVTLTNVDEPPAITGGETLTFDENTETTTILQTYSASDPEGVTSISSWSLGGTDAGDFEISSTGGLTFRNVPDFERAADSGANNEYNVQVRATDDATPPKTGRFEVTVTVNDVNEAPTVSGDDTLSYPENTATTRALDRYTAADPERRPVTWSVSGTDADAFRIDTSGNLYFDGIPDHDAPGDSGGNNVYDIRVVATDDGNLRDGTPSSLGRLSASFDVAVTVTPVDEPPDISGTTTINNYPENGTGNVAAYTATDPEGDSNITWTLGGPDRGDFTIAGGVLQFAGVPDYERPVDSGGNNHYEVTVQAADSNNRRGTRHVDVIVTNVDEPPEVTGPETVDDFPENSSTGRQVGRYTATDPEGVTVTLSLSSGGSDFTLGSNGTVTFNESPDYEARSSYSFTVRAAAGSGTVNTVNKPATVNIQNIEEPGAVTLSAVQPQEGIALTATLEDDDGPSGTAWQWYRTSSRGSAGTALTGETSNTYTPVGDDVGFYLRVVATYDDPHGDDKTVAAVAANRTLAVNPDNVRPEFPTGGNYQRSIRENTRAGTDLGPPVRANDANNDRLTYSIPSSDYFEIVAATGQLRTRVELDHEDQATRTVIVTAADPGNLTATQTVTITVEDADETPEVSGPSNVDFDEGAAGNVATYTATDPDDTGVSLELTGGDRSDFTLSGSGALTFNGLPDFETKSQYRVTIEAREQSPGTSVGRRAVTIHVTNLDEPGIVEVPVSEPRVGQPLRATVSDPDGGVGSIEWKWERREPGGDWTPIPGALSSTYTPTRDDNGNELRVVAIYRDRHGPGKTYTHEFSQAVVLRPYFDSDTATRAIGENTPAGRNVGGRFTARHPDNANLTYTVGGRDAINFTIEDTGQLKTGTTPLDYEGLTDDEAEVEITATAPDNQTATVTVTVTVTNECSTAGEPPCAPGRPGVRSASDTSLEVTWSTPRTPSGTAVTGYGLRYRESGSGGSWIPETVTGTDRSHAIENLIKDTAYEVQIRATNDGSEYGEWSVSGTGTPGGAAPPPPGPPGGGAPPPPPLPPLEDSPSVLITRSPGSGHVLVRPGSPISLTATFSTPVTGFTVDDITAVNGMAGNLDGTGTVYTFQVTPTGIGEVTVEITEGVAEDAEGNGNAAASGFSLGLPYDDDGDSLIDRAEVIQAINDYLDGTGEITRAQVIQLINIYLDG